VSETLLIFIDNMYSFYVSHYITGYYLFKELANNALHAMEMFP